MKYLLLIYEAEEIWDSKTPEERAAVLAQHRSLQAKLDANGIPHTGEPLMPTSTAMSVQVRGGKRQVRDGPFAETKEQLGGFYLIDVPTMEEAMEYAAMLPPNGTIEVRAVAELDSCSGEL